MEFYTKENAMAKATRYYLNAIELLDNPKLDTLENIGLDDNPSIWPEALDFAKFCLYNLSDNVSDLTGIRKKGFRIDRGTHSIVFDGYVEGRLMQYTMYFCISAEHLRHGITRMIEDFTACVYRLMGGGHCYTPTLINTIEENTIEWCLVCDPHEDDLFGYTPEPYIQRTGQKDEIIALARHRNKKAKSILKKYPDAPITYYDAVREDELNLI